MVLLLFVKLRGDGLPDYDRRSTPNKSSIVRRML